MTTCNHREFRNKDADRQYCSGITLVVIAMLHSPMEQGDTERPPERESPQHQGPNMVTGESTPPDDIAFINDQTIERLTHGLIAHYLPDLQDSKQALQELTQNQVILLDTLDQEITKFKDCNSLLDLNSLFTEAKIYHTKLVNIRKDMMVLHDKTTKLKKRALKLQQQRQKEALEKEQQREKELERERQLIAKPARRT